MNNCLLLNHFVPIVLYIVHIIIFDKMGPSLVSHLRFNTISIATNHLWCWNTRRITSDLRNISFLSYISFAKYKTFRCQGYIIYPPFMLFYKPEGLKAIWTIKISFVRKTIHKNFDYSKKCFLFSRDKHKTTINISIYRFVVSRI